RAKFSGNKAIDQNLIHPDTAKDKENKLSRAHVYAHGKALAVLRELRERIGEKTFDLAVNRYLREGCAEFPCIKPGELGGYRCFRSILLAVTPKLPEYEKAVGLTD